MKIVLTVVFLVVSALVLINAVPLGEEDDGPVYVVAKYDRALEDGRAFGYKLSDDTLFHQETHNVQVGEELVPVSSGKYSYRTAKGLFTVNWTADREHGFVATETFEDK